MIFKREQKSLIQTQRYSQVFTTPEGQYVLNDLMQVCHMLSPTHVTGDAHETAFREGKRNVVLRILQILGTDSEKLKEMINEGDES